MGDIESARLGRKHAQRALCPWNQDKVPLQILSPGAGPGPESHLPEAPVCIMTWDQSLFLLRELCSWKVLPPAQ